MSVDHDYSTFSMSKNSKNNKDSETHNNSDDSSSDIQSTSLVLVQEQSVEPSQNGNHAPPKTRSARYSNWIGAMFIRFGASCCPTWDPTNWFSRRLPTLFGIKSRPAENEKLLRTESEEEVFRKRPKRKVRRRRNSADDTADSHHYQLSTADTAGASADVGHSAAAGHTGQNGQNLVTSGGEDKTISESSSFTSDSQIKPGKGRSRREQAALAAKSRRGGRGGYTAANLRRFAAEKKDKSCDKQSDKSSLTAIKNHSGTSSSNSTNHQPVVLKGT